MRCTIPGQGVKLFGRAILCLSKIGDELYLEAKEHQLALRTVNSSRSAYACFLFSENFFTEYEGATDPSNEEVFKCKLAARACLGAFKSLNSIERIVDSCVLQFDPDDVRMVFTMTCRHGIIKTYNLAFQECESLQAVFAKEQCPNLIVAPSKTLMDSVGNFPNSCDEISLLVSPQNVVLKNYVEDEKDPSKVVHTEMTLVPGEFDNFQIGVNCEITFCLKELRAILTFSEYANQPVSIHFETSGKPAVFTLDGDAMYSADFVLATLMDENAAMSQTPSQASQLQVNSESQSQPRVMTTDRPCHDSHPLPSDSQRLSNDGRADTPQGQATTVSNHSTPKQHGDVNDDNFFGDSFPYKDLFDVSSKSPRDLLSSGHLANKSMRSGRSLLSTPCAASPQSAVFPILGASICRESSPADDEAEDIIPGTPPQKKFKSMFFSADRPPSQMALHQQVLAADTDDDDDGG